MEEFTNLNDLDSDIKKEQTVPSQSEDESITYVLDTETGKKFDSCNMKNQMRITFCKGSKVRDAQFLNVTNLIRRKRIFNVYSSHCHVSKILGEWEPAAQIEDGDKESSGVTTLDESDVSIFRCNYQQVQTCTSAKCE